jgi:fatty-acyl-CoA synthase
LIDVETGISLWLSQWARRQPDKDLLVLEDEAISWGDFDERVTRLANALEGLGVTPGDRVGVLLKNCPEFLQSYWAALRRGAIFIPLNVHLAPSELAWVITNADIKVVVTDEQFDAAVTEVAPTVPVEHWISAKGTLGIAHHALADLVAQASPVLRPVPIAMSDPLGIFYTSGTTGLPKGAVLTHGNVFHSTLNWMVDLGLGHDDLHLNFLPLCFTGGIVSGSMWVFHAGASSSGTASRSPWASRPCSRWSWTTLPSPPPTCRRCGR